MSFFSGKVVIVTGENISLCISVQCVMEINYHVVFELINSGSSNGIGRSTAVLFAKNGAKVTITGRNSASLEVSIVFV